MSITNTEIKVKYSPTALTDNFPFDIRYFEDTDINVEIVNELGATKILTLDAIVDGFSVTAVNGRPENGATVTTTEKYTTGDVLTLYREVPETQEAVFLRGGDIPTEVLNTSLDRGVAISQQLTDGGIRHLTCPITDPDGLTYDLPTVELRKNKVVGFDDNGSAITIDVGGGGGLVGVDTSKGLEVNSGIVAGKVDGSTMKFDTGGDFAVDVIDNDNIADGSIETSNLVDDLVTLPKIYPVTIGTVIGNTTGDTEEVAIKDEDNLVSDSDVALATQQSIKAYIDKLKPNIATFFKTDAQRVQSTSTGTWVDMFDMSLNFTPKFANSLIKITYRVCGYSSGNAVSAPIRMTEDLSPIGIGDVDVDKPLTTPCGSALSNIEGVQLAEATQTIIIPANTIQVRVYKLQYMLNINQWFGINYPEAYTTNDPNHGRGVSEIIVEEIYQNSI